MSQNVSLREMDDSDCMIKPLVKDRLQMTFGSPFAPLSLRQAAHRDELRLEGRKPSDISQLVEGELEKFLADERNNNLLRRGDTLSSSGQREDK